MKNFNHSLPKNRNPKKEKKNSKKRRKGKLKNEKTTEIHQNKKRGNDVSLWASEHE